MGSSVASLVIEAQAAPGAAPMRLSTRLPGGVARGRLPCVGFHERLHHPPIASPFPCHDHERQLNHGQAHPGRARPAAVSSSPPAARRDLPFPGALTGLLRGCRVSSPPLRDVAREVAPARWLCPVEPGRSSLAERGLGAIKSSGEGDVVLHGDIRCAETVLYGVLDWSCHEGIASDAAHRSVVLHESRVCRVRRLPRRVRRDDDRPGAARILVSGPPPAVVREERPPPRPRRSEWIRGYWHWTRHSIRVIPGATGRPAPVRWGSILARARSTCRTRGVLYEPEAWAPSHAHSGAPSRMRPRMRRIDAAGQREAFH